MRLELFAFSAIGGVFLALVVAWWLLEYGADRVVAFLNRRSIRTELESERRQRLNALVGSRSDA